MTYLTSSVTRIIDSVYQAPRDIIDLISELSKSNAQKKFQLKQQLERMRLDGLVHLSGDVVELTSRGKILFDKANLGDVKIKKYRWNGIWHIVAWDIPSKQKSTANVFRNLLKKLDFTMVNKSFWVFPYRCREEIAVIAKRLGISRFVIYLQTVSLPNASNLVSKYHLQVKITSPKPRTK